MLKGSLRLIYKHVLLLQKCWGEKRDLYCLMIVCAVEVRVCLCVYIYCLSTVTAYACIDIYIYICMYMHGIALDIQNQRP